MSQVRMLISLSPTTGLPRDAITNTLYFDTDLDLVEGVDWEALADDLCDLYVTLGANIMPSGVGQVTVKAYDMSDPEPRPVKAQVAKNITGSGSFGPREVALCFSYRADRNLPRHRGRVFLGPIRGSLMGERPPSSINPALTNFANGLSALGGVNVQWVVHSKMDQAFRTVKAWWVDDEWDTVRSRGLKATTRHTGTVDG